MVQSIAPIDSYQRVVYLDCNTQYSLNGAGILLSNISALNNQILNVLDTLPGELDFEYTFGSNVPYLLFDPPDDETAWNIETETFYALDVWLGSRLQLDYRSSRVIPNNTRDGFYARTVYTSPIIQAAGYVTLAYNLPLLGQR